MQTYKTNHSAQRGHRAVTFRLAGTLLFGALAGCHMGGLDRNPSFHDVKAPGPTTPYEFVQCGPVASEAIPTLGILYKARVPSPKSRVSESLETMLCALLKGDRDSINLFTGSSDRWIVSPSLQILLKAEADAAHAGSLFFLVVKEDTVCQNEQAIVRDEHSRTIGSIETNRQHCGASPYVKVEGLLFSSQGEFLWSDTEAGDRRRTGAMDEAFMKVIERVPADLNAPMALPTVAFPGPSPIVSTQL